MLKRLLQSLAALLTITPQAHAHDGPRIWVDQLNGQLVTLTSNNDFAPTTYTPSRLFASQFGYESINPLTTEFPGFEAPRGTQHHLSNGTVIGFNIAGPAWYFDSAQGLFETTAEHFGNNPTPQIGIGISFNNTRKTADGPVAGATTLLTFTATGGVSNQNHGHVEFAILGNGLSPSTAPDGVYVLPLELTSTSLQASQTFYLLLGTAGAQTQPGSALFEQAMTAAKSQFINAPGDLDGDGDIDDADFGMAFAAFTGPGNGPSSNPFADLDSDGDVDDADFGLAFSYFTGPGTAIVPEPAALTLITLLPLLGRRRR